MNEVTIIGAGLAGLMAGWQAAKSGKKVKVIAKGWGATHWLSGCVDVIGYYPVDQDTAVANPKTAVAQLIADQPQHPYALAGLDNLTAALDELKALCAAAGYPLHGSLERNWLLPSGVGTFRPTCLAPETMIAGDLSHDTPMLIVGLRQLMDFFPNVIADNLSQQGIPTTHTLLDLPSLRERNFNVPMGIATMMEQPKLRSELVAQLKPLAGTAERIGLPAILGVDEAIGVKEDLERRLGRPVFEIPSLTPSIPGIRLHRILTSAIAKAGGRVEAGMEAIGAKSDAGRVTAVYTETAARPHPHRAQKYVLATGGILVGGITTDSMGEIREVVFNLPVTAPEKQVDWFHQDFLDKRGHPIYHSGLSINDGFQPVNNGDEPVYENLYAAGTTLAHCEVIRERSFEGVALATGYTVAQRL